MHHSGKMRKMSHSIMTGKISKSSWCQEHVAEALNIIKDQKQRTGLQPGAELSQSPPLVTHLPAMPSFKGSLQHPQTAPAPGNHMHKRGVCGGHFKFMA